MSRTRKKSRRKLDTIANSVATVNNLATGQTLVYGSNSWANGYPQGFGTYPVDITGIQSGQTLVWNGIRWIPSTATITVTGRSYLGANPNLVGLTGGDQVRLTGTGLNAVQSVIIDNTPVSVFAATPTALTITTPALASGFHVIYLVTSVDTYRVAQSLAAGTTLVLTIGTPDITLNSLSAYSNLATITGGIGAANVSLSGTLSGFLTYLNGTVSGTLPRVTQDTSYSYTITATDGVQTVSAVATVTVKFIPIVWVTAAGSLQTVNDNLRSGFSYTLSATYLAAPITVFGLTSGALPGGLSLNVSTGVISGNITAVTANTVYSFTVTAYAPDGFTIDSRNFTITVNSRTFDTLFGNVPVLIKTGASLTRSTTVTDASSNNVAVTRLGTPPTGIDGPYQTDGYWGGFFNGSTDYLTYNQTFALGTNDFTLELWLNIPVQVPYPSSYWLWGWRNNTDNCPGLYLSSIPSGNGNLLWFTGNLGFMSNPNNIPLNTWTHIAITRTGLGANNLKMYINGVQVSQSSNASSFTYTGTQPIGANASGQGTLQPTLGYISNLRLVNGVAVYTTTFTPPTAPLTATQSANVNGNPSAAITGTQTGLLTCQSSRFKDNSNNNYTFTFTGAPQATPVYYPSGFAAPSASLGAAILNGTTDYFTAPNSSGGILDLSTRTVSTVECWVYPTSRNTGQATIAGTKMAAGGGWELRINTNGTVQFYKTATGTTITSSATAPLNQWTFVATTQNGTALTLHVNSVSVSNTTGGAGSFSSITCGFGGDSATVDAFPGYIANLRISTVVRTIAIPTAALTTDANTSILLNFADSNYTGATNAVQNNTFIDNSPYAFTVTRTGTPTQGSVTPYWPNNGYWSNYLNGGASDNLTIANNTAYEMGASDYTLELWYYATVNADAGLAFKGTYTTPSNTWSSPGFGIRRSGNSGFIFYFNTNTTLAAQIAYSATASNPENMWHHVAMVVRSGVGYAYLNGVLLNTGGTAGVGTLPTGTNGLTIGKFPYSVVNIMFTGYISNVRLVKGVAVYTGNFTLPAAPLTTTQSAGTNIAAITGTATSLLICQSNRFHDNSNTNAAISANGTAQVQAFQPFLLTNNYSAAAYGGSGYFNGSTDYLSVPSNAAFAFGAGNFTVEGWVYFNGLNAAATGIFQQATSLFPATVANTVAFSTAGTSNFQFYANGANNTFSPTVPPVVNQWYHFAIVKNSGTTTAYLNGVSRLSIADSTNYTGTFFGIGNIYGFNGYLMNGYISNLRIVKGVAVYTGTFTPPTLAPLTTAGSTSAASYSSTTNVNTSFATANTILLLNFANAGIYDATARSAITTVSTAQASTVQKQWLPSSMRFNGSTDYLLFPSNPVFALGTGDFTIEVWVYPMSSTGTQGIMGIGVGGTTGDLQFFYNFAGNTNKVTLNCTNGTTATSTASVPLNQWTYVAFSRTSGSLRLFINGTLDRTLSYADNFNKNVVSVGRSYSNLNQEYFNGYIQDLRITRGVGRNITAAPTDEFPTVAVDPLTLVTTTATTTTTTTTTTTAAPAGPGQAEYTTPGTYNWTAPAGVTSVSVVCIGGGGAGIYGGATYNGDYSNGGGGGGLGWKNNITVVPGTNYTVVVGAGGTPTTFSGTQAGDSYFISATIVRGGGSSLATLGSPVRTVGGTFVGDGGGNGGTGGYQDANFQTAGGGGAGGYAGAGGAGGLSNGGSGTAGSGGGGGGAGGGGGGGGGVGIYGQGTNGTGGGPGVVGGGGSSGTNGSSSGGTYGGGGGGQRNAGGNGAVRIIWGGGRSFPSNAANL